MPIGNLRENDAPDGRWRVGLATLGAVLLAVALVLLVWALVDDRTTIERTTDGVVTRVTEAGPPSAALTVGCLALGVVCLLAAASFDRLTALPVAGVGGGAFDLNPATATKVARATAEKVGVEPGLFSLVFSGAVTALLDGTVVVRDLDPASVGTGAPEDIENALVWRAVDYAAHQAGYVGRRPGEQPF